MSDTYDWISGFNIGEARTNSPLPPDYNIYLHGDGQSFRGFVRNDFSAADHYRNGDGWKIHLSIDPQDLSRAWDKVISPVLLDAKVGAAKFAVGDNLTGMADPANSQAGKVITIYGSGNRSWDEIARDLETGLAREGIKPGPAQIAGDRMVNGSQYIGYRNERAFGALAAYGDKYGYLGADRIRAAVRDGVVTPGMEYNPAGQPDSLQNIDFSRDPDVARARGPVAHDVPLEAPAAKPAKQGFFGRLFGDKTHQPQSTTPEQPSISTPVMEERASVPATWENYQSGAFGESMRFSEPFPRDYGIHKDSRSAAMMRFESQMQAKGVNVQWGFKGEHAYAYVPATDGASTRQLNQLIRSPQAPERTSPSSAVSNAAASVQADLQTALGEQNVLNVERVNGGYRVEVPPTYSRNELARAGIDPTGLQRQAPQYGNHSILIPEDRLPASIARDARVFDALDRAGISDVASNAYRVGQNGRATGYVIDVPETYSRQNLAAAGIDTSRIPSSARENLGNGLHRITIPVEATLEVGSVAPTVPRQMSQQQQHSRLNMTDEERTARAASQLEQQKAMLAAATVQKAPVAPEIPVTSHQMNVMEQQQQSGGLLKPAQEQPHQQQTEQQRSQLSNRSPDPSMTGDEYAASQRERQKAALAAATPSTPTPAPEQTPASNQMRPMEMQQQSGGLLSQQQTQQQQQQAQDTSMTPEAREEFRLNQFVRQQEILATNLAATPTPEGLMSGDEFMATFGPAQPVPQAHQERARSWADRSLHATAPLQPGSPEYLRFEQGLTVYAQKTHLLTVDTPQGKIFYAAPEQMERFHANSTNLGAMDPATLKSSMHIDPSGGHYIPYGTMGAAEQGSIIRGLEALGVEGPKALHMPGGNRSGIYFDVTPQARAANPTLNDMLSSAKPEPIITERRDPNSRGAALRGSEPQVAAAVELPEVGTDRWGRKIPINPNNARSFAYTPNPNREALPKLDMDGLQGDLVRRAQAEPDFVKRDPLTFGTKGNTIPTAANDAVTPHGSAAAPMLHLPDETPRINGGSIKAGIAGAVISATIRGGLTTLNKNASGMEIAQSAGLGFADALLPGASDGFADIRGVDKQLNWGDRALATLDAVTGGAATGAAIAAPETGGTSLGVTAVAGAGNLLVGLTKDVGYSTGLTHRPGLITGGASIVTTVTQAWNDHQDFVARKAAVPEPVVQQFIAGLANAHGNTSDAALNAFIVARDLAMQEHTTGIVQSGSSQARFGNLPMGTISSAAMNDRIDDAARAYLANGGTLELAMTALQGGNLDQTRTNLLTRDLINLVPTKSTVGTSYPTGDKNLEQLRILKQQHEDHPEQRDALYPQMENLAASYLNTGKTARDALTSYFHFAPFTISTETIAKLEQNSDFMQGFDGADGTKKDGKLTPREIGAAMAKLGIYNDKADSNHDGELGYTEALTAKRTPAEFQANTPSKERS